MTDPAAPESFPDSTGRSVSGRTETLEAGFSGIPGECLPPTHSGPTPTAYINSRLKAGDDPTRALRPD